MGFVSGLETKLRGWPDRTISIVMMTVAVGLIGVAIFARPIVKPLVLAWVLAP